MIKIIKEFKIKLIKKGKTKIVNEYDVPEYLTKGWKVADKKVLLYAVRMEITTDIIQIFAKNDKEAIEIAKNRFYKTSAKFDDDMKADSTIDDAIIESKGGIYEEEIPR